LAAEEARDLTTDGEPEAGAAVLAIGRSIDLLERLEDDAVFVARDSDTRVRYRERDDRAPLREGGGLESRTCRRRTHVERDLADIGEFECVREEVLQHLLQTLRIGAYRRHVRRDVDFECEVLLLGERPEVALDVLGDFRQKYLSGLDPHLAGLDLRQ